MLKITNIYSLFTACLLAELLLPGHVLDAYYSYARPGGSPILKIHPGTYLILGIFVAFMAAQEPLVFFRRQAKAQAWALQFFLTTVLIAIIELVKFGTSGLAYMLDTLIVASVMIMLMFSLTAEQRYNVSKLILTFIFINSVVAFFEFISKRHFLPNSDFNEFTYFRAGAIFGHPLANTLITAPALPLIFMTDWSNSRKFIFAGACIISLLCYGTRSGFAIGLTSFGIAMLIYSTSLVLRNKLQATSLMLIIIFVVLSGAGAIIFIATATDLGSRIFERAYVDDSARTRILIFQVFNFITPAQLWNGIPLSDVLILQEKYDALQYLENFWISILLALGIPTFILFCASLLYFFYGLRQGQSYLINIAVITFLILASSSPSLSTKTPMLTLFSVTIYGLRQPKRQASHHPWPKTRLHTP
jgi:polysaccharide biosynthesis protein VpsF